MAKMSQPSTDYGKKGETGEKAPSGAKASDASGERSARLVNGVALGQRDALVGRTGSDTGKHDGTTGELNTGRKGEGHFYTHAKRDYRAKG